MIDRAVIVTRKTALDELVERFNTRAQARFYIEHLGGAGPGRGAGRASGGDFGEYEDAHARYTAAIAQVQRSLPRGLKQHVIERAFLPNYVFSPDDLVLTIGPDGLVVNAAKYLTVQPILAINPDPQRVDGILIPFGVEEAGQQAALAALGRAPIKLVTMAKAALNDGQVLYAFNDLFVGPRSHISIRYRLEYDGQAEDQSSSGLIISTGAGSTGWLQSIVTGAARITAGVTGEDITPPAPETYRLPWEADELYFSVREPFASRTSQASIVFGQLGPRRPLVLRSYMPGNGVIFSDGVEADYIAFNSGTVATIGLAERKARLVARA
jgi:NAD kinase